MKSRLSEIALVMTFTSASIFSQTTVTPLAVSPAGVTGKGGGAFIKSEDGRSVIRFMGYAQPTLALTTKSQHQSFVTPNFLVRRARADFKAEYDSLYTLFFEYDAAPVTGTSLIEAYTQAALIRDRVHFRFGKYIQPFSAENLRSSRGLATVERFQALNALIGLPGIDAQIGAMLWGNLDAGKMFKYYLSVTNGNGSAAPTPNPSPLATNPNPGGNTKDNNSDKEIIGRIECSPIKTAKMGLGFAYDKEGPQNLTLKSYSGAVYDTLHIKGERRALDIDGHATLDKLNLDAEWLFADFVDTNSTLQGGYLQGSYWVLGSEVTGGLEPLMRIEYSKISAEGTPNADQAVLMACTLGANYWMNEWVRWQINLIEETTSRRGNAAYAFSDDGRFLPTAFAQLQIKF
jgi:hypothetical protein